MEDDELDGCDLTPEPEEEVKDDELPYLILSPEGDEETLREYDRLFNG